MRLRPALVVAVVLAALEGLGYLADWHWGYRERLLKGFDGALAPLQDTKEHWDDPASVFNPDFDGPHPQFLRFRPPDSTRPVGADAESAHLPAGRRVFVVGESAAYGVNVEANQTFAALLDERWKAKGTRVINAGQVGADPWQVMDAGAQILVSYVPSALIVFTGNNPWVTWAPPQQERWSWGVVSTLRVLAVSRALAGLEFLLLRETFKHYKPKEGSFRDRYELTGSSYALSHPLLPSPQFGPKDWPPLKALYLQRFETSLTELLRQARSRGVRVVLVTMPTFDKLSPAFLHAQFEAYDPAHAPEVTALVEQAGALVNKGDFAQALPFTEKALALDAEPPLLHYLHAQCLEHLGRLDDAEAAYHQSREHMIGHLGSRLSVNEVIRKVAAQQDVTLVDAEKLFEEHTHAAGKHFNEGLFVDDCHPSAEGHRIIAEALAPLF
jgi:hypothetical protein